MITLQINQYEIVKPMFSGIPQASWHLASMVNKNMGMVIVDNFPSPNTAYLETPYLFYYFTGKYNKSFLKNIINHIIKDLIPIGEMKPAFIFSSNHEWKKGIEEYLQAYINKDFGTYLTRRLYHINTDIYSKPKECFVVPDNYTIAMEDREGSMSAVAYYNNKEVCKCGDGVQGLGYMDFDVFTHPEHRNKGLALICCSWLIDYCLHNNLIPQWGCWTANVPSCKLAVKLGFEVTSETLVNLAEIRNDTTV